MKDDISHSGLVVTDLHQAFLHLLPQEQRQSAILGVANELIAYATAHSLPIYNVRTALSLLHTEYRQGIVINHEYVRR